MGRTAGNHSGTKAYLKAKGATRRSLAAPTVQLLLGMEVAENDVRTTGLIAISWALLGTLLSTVVAVSYWVEVQPIPWLALAAWFAVWLLWLPAGWMLARAVRVRPIDRQTWRIRAAPYVLSGLLVTASFLTLRLLIDRGLHLLVDGGGHPFAVSAFLVQSVVFDALIYTGILAATHALDYYDRYTRRLVQSAELESRLSRVRLAFLRNQMQPHFLLNTLNLISALIYTDPEKADRTIADLGDLLRITLEDASRQEVPLHRELECLEHYLDIARTRFGSALAVERRIDPELESAVVPSLVLQPLVENALRHGLADHNGQSRITIAASRVGDRLRLEVSDNGPGLPLATPGPMRLGIGLGNTRRRLEQLYGASQRLEIRNRTEGGAVAVLELPYRLSDEETGNPDSERTYDHTNSHRGRRAPGAREDQVVSRA